LIVSVIVVCSFWALEETLKLFNPSHIVSLMDHRDAVVAPTDMGAANQLRLGFRDTISTSPRDNPPTPEDIKGLIDFATKWKPSGDPILIHCTAGISRSSAGALIVASKFQPNREIELAGHLRNQAPYCIPNKLMIELADRELSLDGNLTSAVAGMGNPNMEILPEPYVLNFL
jgi:predicted protein tyrosine phosphatase